MVIDKYKKHGTNICHRYIKNSRLIFVPDTTKNEKSTFLCKYVQKKGHDKNLLQKNTEKSTTHIFIIGTKIKRQIIFIDE